MPPNNHFNLGRDSALRCPRRGASGDGTEPRLTPDSPLSAARWNAGGRPAPAGCAPSCSHEQKCVAAEVRACCPSPGVCPPARRSFSEGGSSGTATLKPIPLLSISCARLMECVLFFPLLALGNTPVTRFWFHLSFRLLRFLR